MVAVPAEGAAAAPRGALSSGLAPRGRSSVRTIVVGPDSPGRLARGHGARGAGSCAGRHAARAAGGRRVAGTPPDRARLLVVDAREDARGRHALAARRGRRARPRARRRVRRGHCDNGRWPGRRSDLRHRADCHRVRPVGARRRRRTGVASRGRCRCDALFYRRRTAEAARSGRAGSLGVPARAECRDHGLWGAARDIVCDRRVRLSGSCQLRADTPARARDGHPGFIGHHGSMARSGAGRGVAAGAVARSHWRGDASGSA